MAVKVPPAASSFWEAYGNTDLLVNIECEGPGKNESLATHVLETYGLTVAGNASNIGGSLYGLDIKHMDAMGVINLSLLEQLADSYGAYMYEAVVDPDGDVVFVLVGKDNASLTDIYYQVQSSTYIESCVGVLVRGGKPMPSWRDTEWLPIWGNGDNKLIFDSSRFMSSCANAALSTYATIVFNDPHLDSAYNDGINNLYEMTEPDLRIIGYASYKDAPGYRDESTKISWSNTAMVEVVVADDVAGKGPNIGTLVERPGFDKETIDFSPECWVEEDVDIDPVKFGIKIEMDKKLRFTDTRGKTVDKFQKVEEVYVFGQALSKIKSAPYENDNAARNSEPSVDHYKTIIYLDSPHLKMFKLDPGEDYVIMYKKDSDGFDVPYIVFARNTRKGDPVPYGQGTEYIIGLGGKAGRYHQGVEGTGCILPAYGRGFLVKQVVALVSINTPSIVIHDPEFNGPDEDGYSSRAIDIAKNFTYWVRPLVLHEPPASIAFNGTILDQTVGVKDNDPTTQQDFENTPLELAMDEMASGPGLEITLPFLNDPEEDNIKLEKLSENLFKFMNNETGIEATYVCGPTTEVELGQKGPSGGVVNSITYSYNDSSSYTISVNEGSRMVKPLSGGGPSGPAIKTTESFNARGTVIQALGNGVHFKVRIDGYGERVAVCTCHDVIREGDVVSCSIYNNPVEV